MKKKERGMTGWSELQRATYNREGEIEVQKERRAAKKEKKEVKVAQIG